MSSIVEDFDGDTQDHLYWLRKDMEIGERSDWAYPTFNHIVSMTCGAYLVERQQFPKWYDELCDLLVDLHVESMLPGEKTDSLGDAWAHTHKWTWRDGKKGEAA